MSLQSGQKKRLRPMDEHLYPSTESTQVNSCANETSEALTDQSRRSPTELESPEAMAKARILYRPFLESDYRNVCRWISDSNNFNGLYGVKTRVHSLGAFSTKQEGYDRLAAFVAANSEGRLTGMTGKQMRDRLDKFRRKYRAALLWRQQRQAEAAKSSRVDNQDFVDAKLNRICPCFHELDAIVAPKMIPATLVNAVFPETVKNLSLSSGTSSTSVAGHTSNACMAARAHDGPGIVHSSAASRVQGSGPTHSLSHGLPNIPLAEFSPRSKAGAHGHLTAHELCQQPHSSPGAGNSKSQQSDIIEVSASGALSSLLETTRNTKIDSTQRAWNMPNKHVEDGCSNIIRSTRLRSPDSSEAQRNEMRTTFYRLAWEEKFNLMCEKLSLEKEKWKWKTQNMSEIRKQNARCEMMKAWRKAVQRSMPIEHFEEYLDLLKKINAAQG